MFGLWCKFAFSHTSNITPNGIISIEKLRYAPMTSPRPPAAGGKQLAAVATAAIPVVMLSSLALASPATAGPVKTEMVPAANHGALDGQTVRAAVRARTLGSSVSSTVVATTVPRAVTAVSATMQASFGTALTAQLAMAPPASHTVAAGETVSGIAASYGVSTESVLSLNSIDASALIHPGQLLRISGSAAPQSTPAAPEGSSAADYVVRAGDTLSGIAAEHGVGLSTLFSLNGMDGNSIIHPGQAIKLGAPAPAAAQQAPVQQAPASQTTASGSSYVIKGGDTLSSIAAAHNVSLGALVAANGADVNATIYPGKTLSIPVVNAASSNITPIGPDLQAATPGPVELTPDQQVPSTFLHYTYPQAVVSDANYNKSMLLASPAPSREEMQEMVARTAASMGVDPALAMAFAQQESGFNHQSVSPANAIGTMQVIPDAGEWASGLVGRELNLLDPQDNVTAGVAIIRALHQGGVDEDSAIAGYYQGQYSVSLHGLFPDTVNYVAGIKANRELFR